MLQISISRWSAKSSRVYISETLCSTRCRYSSVLHYQTREAELSTKGFVSPKTLSCSQYRTYHSSCSSMSDTAALSRIFDMKQVPRSVSASSPPEKLSTSKNPWFLTNSNFFLKPYRFERKATILVDGDEISPEIVDSMCTAMAIKKGESRIYIARQPNTPPLSPIDAVGPLHTYVPTPLLIEQKAREWLRLFSNEKPPSNSDSAWKKALTYRSDVISSTSLEDVIFMCATSQWKIYYDQILSYHYESDSDVFLVCPAHSQLVVPKKIIPAF